MKRKSEILDAAGQAALHHTLLKNIRRRGHIQIDSDPTGELELSLFRAGFPKPAREYHFARDVVGEGKQIRKRLAAVGLLDWRFDLAIPTMKIAFELDGGTRMIRRGPRGIMVGGRHNGPKDMMKLNHAQKLGWRVFRFTNEMVRDGTANIFIWNLAADIAQEKQS